VSEQPACQAAHHQRQDVVDDQDEGGRGQPSSDRRRDVDGVVDLDRHTLPAAMSHPPPIRVVVAARRRGPSALDQRAGLPRFRST
jgi:hypothetical protein